MSKPSTIDTSQISLDNDDDVVVVEPEDPLDVSFSSSPVKITSTNYHTRNGNGIIVPDSDLEMSPVNSNASTPTKSARVGTPFINHASNDTTHQNFQRKKRKIAETDPFGWIDTLKYKGDKQNPPSKRQKLLPEADIRRFASAENASNAGKEPQSTKSSPPAAADDDNEDEIKIELNEAPSKRLSRLRRSRDVGASDNESDAEIELSIDSEDSSTNRNKRNGGTKKSNSSRRKKRNLDDDDDFVMSEESDDDDDIVANGRRSKRDEKKLLESFIVDDDVIETEGGADQELDEDEDPLMDEFAKELYKHIPSGRLRNGRLIQRDVSASSTTHKRIEHSFDDVIEKCEGLSARLQSIFKARNMDNMTSTVQGQGFEKQPSILKQNLKDYQLAGLNWLYVIYQQNLSCILGDEMGLGKTIQTIALLALLKQKGDTGPSIVIVPASTLSNWEREFEKWCPALNVIKYYGNQNERLSLQDNIERNLKKGSPDKRYEVILTTYQVAQGKIDRSFLRAFNYTYMILDEAHSVKNINSLRYKQLTKLKCKHRLLLTGTPLQNDLEELWALLHFLMPKFFEMAANVKTVFSELRRLKKKDPEAGAELEMQMVDRMKRALAPFFLRRLKSEVGLQLMPKDVFIIRCRMTQVQRRQYDSIFNKSRTVWLQQQQGAEGPKISLHTYLQNVFMQLRKVANHPLLVRTFYSDEQATKMAQLLHSNDEEFAKEQLNHLIEDFLSYSDFELHKLAVAHKYLAKFRLTDDKLFNSSAKFLILEQLLSMLKQSNKRVLLFSQMTKMLDILEFFMDKLGYKYLRLDGTTSVEERQTLIDTFNNDESVFVFLLSTRAGGLGINLTAADTVIFYDMAFNPQVDRQAEDRCHRLGQQKAVTVYKLICQKSCEEQILMMANEKRLLNDMVLEEGTHAKNKQKDAEDDSSEGAEVLNRVFEGTSNAEDAQRNQEESEDIIEKVDDDTQTPIPNQRHPFTEYIQQARNKSDATTTTKGKHKNSGSPNDAIDLDDDSDE